MRFPFRHANVSHVFILGELYHVLPQILHDFLCNYMANHVVGTATFERAKTKIEKYFNERRKQAKIKRKVGYRVETAANPQTKRKSKKYRKHNPFFEASKKTVR